METAPTSLLERHFLLTLLSPVAFIFIIVHLGRWVSKLREKRHYPPGPKPKFLVGNLFDIPRSEASETYREWGVKYQSDILHASCFGQHFIILNSLKDAEELLELRANIYSDRPRLSVVEMMGWDNNMSFLPLGDLWRKHRRIAQQNLRQDAIAQFQPIQLQKIHALLQGLIDTPEHFEEHNAALSVGIAMSTMYGYDIAAGDPYVQQTLEAATAAFQLMQPGFTWINTFPILRHIPAWFPLATTQKMIQNTKELTYLLMKTPINIVKSKINDGSAIPCMVYNLLESGEVSKEEEKVIAGVAFTVYTGASDTIISATNTFFYLMTTHPEIQAKAQEELDRVIGTGRLPSFEDRRSLPYIEAVYREVLRWRPPAPIGLPHRVMKDDTYKGFFIPEGATVIANIRAMVRDESVYPDAAAFKPERYLDENGELTDDDYIPAYGFGRRICVGKHVASNTVWITFASVLASFTISGAKDDQGRPIEARDDYEEPSVISAKKPFKCSILPRSQATRKLIEEAVEQDNMLFPRN